METGDKSYINEKGLLGKAPKEILVVKHAIRCSDKEALPYAGCESNMRDLQEPSHRRTLLPLSEGTVCWGSST